MHASKEYDLGEERIEDELEDNSEGKDARRVHVAAERGCRR